MIVMNEIGTRTDPEIRELISCIGEKINHNDKNNSYDKNNDYNSDIVVAVLPVGSIEQHGPHLPVSTDSDISCAIARLVAEQNDNYLLLPAVKYGVSYEHAPLFHISTSEDSLYNMIVDLCQSLATNGIHNVAVINGHHGNIGALERLEDKKDDPSQYNDTTKIENNMHICVFHYWRYMQQELGHAGFAETSMMLAISADAVKMNLAQKGLVTDGMSKQQIKEISDLAMKSFLQATKNGIWGDPTDASAKKGHQMLDEVSCNIANMCKTLFFDK